MQQVARMTPVVGGRISTIDFASAGDYLQDYRNTNPQGHQNHSNMSAFNDTNPVASLDGVASGVDSTDGTDQSPSDGAESEEKSASVEDPDVLAPSDIAYTPKHGQTGLLTTTVHNPEKVEDVPSRIGAEIQSLTEDATVSDDDDYTGVDLISESGDEEPVVEVAEEEVGSDLTRNDDDDILPRSPPNSPYDAFSFTSAEAGQIDFDLDPFLTDDIFFKDQMNILDHEDVDYSASTNNFGFASPLAEPPRRRVRFADPLMLPLEASELFSANDGNRGTSSAQYVQDTSSKEREEQERIVNQICDGRIGPDDEAIRSNVTADDLDPLGIFRPMNTDDDQDDNDEDAESSVGSSSGYETDQGETTEEEDVPACATARPSAVLRDSSTVTLESSFAIQPLSQASTTNLRSSRQWGPKLGSFVTDPTKPIAVVAKDGKQLIIYPAQRPASRGGKVFPSLVSSGQSSVQASPRTAVARMTGMPYPTATDDSEIERSEISSQGITTPMLSASPNLMMSGLGLRSGNMLSGHAMGPPEAFFPFQSIAADGTMIADGVDVPYDDVSSEDEAENMLNIADFINLREDSVDSDQEADTFFGIRPSPASSSPTQSAAKPSSVALSPTQPSFLDHLDKSMVMAFRRNQYESESNEPDLFRQPSKSPFRITNALKANAFVASTSPTKSPSNTPYGSFGKRKLSDQNGESLSYDHTFTKRRLTNPS